MGQLTVIATAFGMVGWYRQRDWSRQTRRDSRLTRYCDYRCVLDYRPPQRGMKTDGL